jgi:hypothetical protein
MAPPPMSTASLLDHALVPLNARRSAPLVAEARERLRAVPRAGFGIACMARQLGILPHFDLAKARRHGP